MCLGITQDVLGTMTCIQMFSIIFQLIQKIINSGYAVAADMIQKVMIIIFQLSKYD
jgi:hypothetical protein